MLLPIAVAFSGLDPRLQYAMQITGSMAGLLLLWRLWIFTVRPLLKPDEPKILPYWIPCERPWPPCPFLLG